MDAVLERRGSIVMIFALVGTAFRLIGAIVSGNPN